MPKIAILILVLFSIQSGQTNSDFYYYQNQRIYLDLQKNQLSLRFTQKLKDNEVQSLLQKRIPGQVLKFSHMYGEDSRLIEFYSPKSRSELQQIIDLLHTDSIVLRASYVYDRKGKKSAISDKIIVRFSENLNREEIVNIVLSSNCRIVEEKKSNTYILSLNKSSALNALEVANQLYLRTETIWAHPNFTYFNFEILNQANDTYYSQQWAHKNIGQEVQNNGAEGYPNFISGYPDADMDVDLAWTELKNSGIDPGAGVLVGVIDSGIELEHPDLQSNIADPGRDFTTDNQANGNDIGGHGTSIAGIIAAEADNGLGIAGIAPNAKLLPVKIITNFGGAEDQDIAEAIDYAWEFGCDILSNSWTSSNPTDVVRDALVRAKNQGRDGKGCIILFSTGNDGNAELQWPSAIPEVVGVGAANMFNQKKNHGSSDYDRKYGSNYGDGLDVLAASITYTTDLTGEAGYTNSDYFESFAGTSASCPNAAGVAALILSANNTLISDEVQEILQTSAEQIDQYLPDANGWNRHTGYGRVNAYLAVLRALQKDGDMPKFSFTPIPSGTDIAPRILEVKITDNSGIAEAALFYRTSYRDNISEWQRISATDISASTYLFEIPGQQWETKVEYYLYARDASESNHETTFPTPGSVNDVPFDFFEYHVGELNNLLYESSDVPVSWNDAFEFYSSSITVNENFSIVDLNLNMDVDGQVSDFSFVLDAPSDKSTAVVAVNPGEAYANTTLDDEATTLLINSPSTSYTGNFIPDNQLSVFDGESSTGDWQLTVYDDFQYNNGGSINGWNLDLTYVLENPVPVVSDIPDQTISEGGTFSQINLSQFVSDDNHTDEEMTWSYTGNIELIVTIDNDIATISAPDADWFGQETITFIATDPGGAQGNDAAIYTAQNVNDAPVVSDIPSQTIDEGESFASIELDQYVNDIDNSDQEITWTYSGNNELIINIDENRVAAISTPDSNWFGQETITFTAADPEELSDADTAVFLVNSVNDAPIVSDIPNQTISEGESFNEINLNNYVTDVDHSEDDIVWSYSGNSEINVEISSENIATLSTPDSEWSGSETILFTATDPGEMTDSDSAIFTVNSVNDAPVVSDIPSQKIDEGESFTSIELDQYVNDNDNSDQEITWMYSGNSELIINIDENRVATVSTPDSNWFGQETITFTATDPGELSDADTVLFRVSSVNDKPIVTKIPDQEVNEGDAFSQILLDEYVNDVDHSDQEIEWNFSGNSELEVIISIDRVATINIPGPDWFGSEDIQFIASDPENLADTSITNFTVISVNDTPFVDDIPDQSVPEGSSFTDIELDNFVDDKDHSDDQISWSYSGNDELSVTISADRIATIAIPNSQWNGSEIITFTATDPLNAENSDDVIFSVGSKNDPPQISDIPDQTIEEGSSFAEINLDDYVTDPDNNDEQLSWTSEGNNELLVSIDSNRIARIDVPDIDWNGSETLIFIVKDPDSLQDSDEASFIVSAVNDTPQVSNIPDQTVNEGDIFASINLDQYVYDVDNDDDEMNWTFSGNTELNISIDENRVATITTPDTNWIGNETITFKANDPGNLGDQDSVIFSVNNINDAPIIGDIPSQTINEGESFSTLILDDFVNDPDNDDTEIEWQVSGNSNINVNIDSERRAFITVADSNWFGQELLTFTALDPYNLSDSDTALFKVLALNDPPRLKQDLPNFSMPEDSQNIVLFETWFPFVEDPDNKDPELIFSIKQNKSDLFISKNDSSFLFNATKDWFGQDTLMLNVSDGQLADSGLFEFIVSPVNDAPNIVGMPDSVLFSTNEEFTLNFAEFEQDTDTPLELLTWILEPGAGIKVNYDSTSKIAEISAENFIGESFLETTLIDDSSASDIDTIIVIVKSVTEITKTETLPREYVLKQNYPNPFNPITIIQYSLPKTENVKLKIFDINGRLVKTLIDQEQPAGEHKLVFDAAGLTSAVYYYQLVTKHFIKTKKMLLIR